MRGLALLAGLLLTACGSNTPAPLPPACSGSSAAIVRALGAAPGDVRLAGGTHLSDCVKRADDDGELQDVGFAFTPAADTLAERGTPLAAGELGFLLGAVHRGSSTTNGIHAELVRRLDAVAARLDDPTLLAAVRHGIAAGEAHG